MEATTKQLREIASVRQRAEERANRFMEHTEKGILFMKRLNIPLVKQSLIDEIIKHNL